ncbi:MAG TPA: hypothetical protein PLW34_09325 [Termitinemataceae bacterium]|nr:hypothetical protein [Termitinemataceae bacterium]HOM23947.1 hypothetical protein [Termitinemataceae bacterium]
MYKSIGVFFIVLSLTGYLSCSQESKARQLQKNMPQAMTDDTASAQSKGPRSIVVPQLPIQSIPQEVSQTEQKHVSVSLVIPSGNEGPHYPIDFILGPLGKEGFSDEAYEFARSIVKSCVQRDMEWLLSQGLSQEGVQELRSLLPTGQVTYRIGGGERQKGGGYSFLFRLIGEGSFYTGTAYVDQEGDRFLIEEIKIEKDPPLSFDPLNYTSLVFN